MDDWSLMVESFPCWSCKTLCTFFHSVYVFSISSLGRFVLFFFLICFLLSSIWWCAGQDYYDLARDFKSCYLPRPPSKRDLPLIVFLWSLRNFMMGLLANAWSILTWINHEPANKFLWHFCFMVNNLESLICSTECVLWFHYVVCTFFLFLNCLIYAYENLN